MVRKRRRSQNAPSDKDRSEPRGFRVYIHRECGSACGIDGLDYLGLSNPFSITFWALCLTCDRAVGLDEVFWTDTGESIADSRRRVRASVPLPRRVFYFLVGPFAGGLMGAPAAVILCGIIAAFDGRGMDGRLATYFAILGFLVGFFLGAGRLSEIVLKNVFGVDFRGA